MNHNAPPLNPLPAIVWLIALPMIAMEVVLALGSGGLVGGAEAGGWRIRAIEDFGFFPDWAWTLIQRGVYPPEMLMRFVTYPFVHGDTTHAIFVIVILLALGKMVGEVFRWWAVAVVFFGAAIAGAAAYMALPWATAPLFGGYPGVYGLIGAFTFLLWVRLAGTGNTQYRAFTMIGFLLGFQILFSVVFGGGLNWVADLAGFVTGFLLSFVVSPGGWGHVMARLRQR